MWSFPRESLRFPETAATAHCHAHWPSLACFLCASATILILLWMDARRQRLVLHPSDAMEGMCIYGNGLGYYAWLRSLCVDGDLCFDNEFDEHRVANDYVPPPAYRTVVGRRANHWSVGPACLWAVPVCFVHVGLLITAADGRWPPDGYCCPYQLAVGASTLACGFLTVVVLWKIACQYASPMLGRSWQH